MQNGRDAHDECGNCADDARNRGAFDAQFRKTEIAADEQIVEDDVNAVGNNVRIHGDPGVADAALCRVDNK